MENKFQVGEWAEKFAAYMQKLKDEVSVTDSSIGALLQNDLAETSRVDLKQITDEVAKINRAKVVAKIKAKWIEDLAKVGMSELTAEDAFIQGVYYFIEFDDLDTMKRTIKELVQLSLLPPSAKQ